MTHKRLLQRNREAFSFDEAQQAVMSIKSSKLLWIPGIDSVDSIIATWSRPEFATW